MVDTGSYVVMRGTAGVSDPGSPWMLRSIGGERRRGERGSPTPKGGHRSRSSGTLEEGETETGINRATNLAELASGWDWDCWSSLSLASSGFTGGMLG